MLYLAVDITSNKLNDIIQKHDTVPIYLNTNYLSLLL